MNKYFTKAVPVWGKDKLKEINCSLFFKCDFPKGEYDFVIAANNLYRLYINGEFYSYGPARAAHDYYRVDKHHFKADKEINIIVVEVYGCNCNNFYILNSEPFFQAELLLNNEVIKYSGKDFKCYNNDFRYRKVVRLSFQRAFSESYHIDNKVYKAFLTKKSSKLTRLPVVKLKEKVLIDRGVKFPLFNDVQYRNVEYGNVDIDSNIKPWFDRYMDHKALIIFEPEEWEVDPNKVASQFVPHRGAKSNIRSNGEFITASNKVSLTGFINVKLKVIEDAEVYICFDEIDTRKEGED